MHISLNYKLYKFQINYKNQSTILSNKKYSYRYIIYIVLNINVYCNFKL